jgi:hypothetical protein
LPSGVFVRHADWGEDAYLVWNGGLLAWTAGGYTKRIDRPKKAEVAVLTPEATVAAIRAGYVPEVHPSAVALPKWSIRQIRVGLPNGDELLP